MKKPKFTIIALFAIFMSLTLFGQPTPVTTIETPTSVSCGVYDVDVTVQDFTNVGAISLILNFDPLVFECTGVTMNTAISTTPNITASGDIIIGWFGSGVTLVAPNNVLFTMHLKLLPTFSGGTTDFEWSTVAGECEYASPGGTVVYASTFNDLTWTIPVRPVKNINTGLEYCTIQAAIDDPLTQDLHTITVAAGTYHEDLDVNKSLTLKAASTPIIDGGGALENPAIHITATDVTVEGFIIENFIATGAGQPSDIGAILVEGDNANILYNIVRNITCTGTAGSCPAGLGIDVHANNVEVIDNEVYDISSIGIRVRHDWTTPPGTSNNILIDDNDVYHTGNSCVLITGYAKGVTLTNNDIYESLETGTAYNLFVHYGASDITIGGVGVGNHIHDAYANIVLAGCDNVTIEDNLIEDATPLISNPTAKGKNIYILNDYNSWTGTPNLLSTNVDILGNDILNAADGYGVRIRNIGAADPSAMAATTEIHLNNIVGNTGFGVENLIPTVVDAENNYWGHATGPYHNPNNTCGLGDPVSDNVDFMPWWTTETGGTGTLAVHNTTKGTYYCTIQDAVQDANPTGGNDITVAAGTYFEAGQIVIDKNLTLTGADKNTTIIKPDHNTTIAGYVQSDAWIYVASGISFNLSNFTLDGRDLSDNLQTIRHAIQSRGELTVEHCIIQHIHAAIYYGRGIVLLAGASNYINDVSMNHIQRIGIHIRGGVEATNPYATVKNFTYVGKGAIDCLDYGIEFGGGGQGVVGDILIPGSGCNITNCYGIASVDGSTSAGILITDYYGTFTIAEVYSSVLTNNSYGIAVGYDTPDISVLTAHNNKIYGNTVYGIEALENTVIDAENNWWGHASGPYNDPYNTCGSGNEVAGPVDFMPWWTDIGMSTLSVTLGPAEDGGPVPIASTVECASSAIIPTLPTVIDYCGITLTPTGPAMGGTYTGCEGTITYTYTYTDPLLQTMTWVYTYTIDHTTAPVVPDNGASVVECLAGAVPPLAQTYDPLVQTPYPDADCLFNTYMNGVVDQQQPTWNNYVLNYNTGVGQSFTPATSGNLTQIDIDVYWFSGTPGFLLEVYAGNGKVGSPLYSSAGYSISSVGSQSLTIPPTALPLVSGTQYTFWLTPYPLNSVWLKIAYGTNPYAGGMAWDEIPTAVIVTDVCGVSIPTPTPVITDIPNPITCEGTRIYTYTYTDCSGLSTDWVYTYTIDHTTPPAEVGGPVTSASNVECISDAVPPTTLPVVEDVCGVVLSPTGPVITENPDPLTNDGIRTYTYTYTDCASLSYVWSYIYTIEDVTDPIITCATPAASYNADPGVCSFTVDEFVAPDVDYFWMSMDGPGNLLPGSGGIANDPGEDGLWYLYHQDPPDVWWWNIWFYNEDYDPNRLKIIRMGFWIQPLDPGFGGYINYVVNWSLPGWVSPPFPDPGFPMPPDEIFIDRSSVNNYILPGPDPEWIELYWVIPDYNPEWVSVDIWGENIIIEQILMAPPVTSPLYKWWVLNPGPGGIIVHECLPKLPLPGTFLDPTLIDDNCGVASVINDKTGTSTLNGATFPVGTNTVTWTVTDFATPPNTATCFYDVVVVDNQPPTITCAVPANPYSVNNGCFYVVPGTALDPTATWDNCGVASVINSYNSTNTLAGAAFPVGSTPVTWTVTDINGNPATCNYNVVVNYIALSGNLTYHNGGQALTAVVLTLDDGATPLTTTTAALGAYAFNNLCAGTYTLSANFGLKPVGGINATDAAQTNYWGVAPWSIEKVRFYAGDAVLTNHLDGTDASKILSYFVTAGGSTISPPWKFWVAGETISANQTLPPVLQIPTVTIGGGDAIINLLGQVTGDFNMSYSAASKGASESLLLKEGKNIFAEVGTELELPIVAGMDMDIGAVSLILNFPSDKVEISDVFLTSDPSSPLMYNISGDELRIGWNSLIPAYLDKGESLITLKMKVISESGEEGISMSLVADPLNELADENFFVINDAVLVADVIHTSALGIANNMADKLAFANHPNPFKGTTNFVYSLPVDGRVILEIYDLVGNKVMTVVDEAQTAGDYTVKLETNRLQPGVYTATLRLSNEDSKLVRTIKILSR